MPEDFRNDKEFVALYEVLLEGMKLSAKDIQILHRSGVTTIGDCIDYFVAAQTAMITVPHEFAHIMETEVRKKLMEYGYWRFYELAIRD